jgi:hypothetical protein
MSHTLPVQASERKRGNSKFPPDPSSQPALPGQSIQFVLACRRDTLKRMMKCGKASCRCQHDRAARHGPYYEWGYMRDGKLVHRYVSPEQAEVLQQAITNYRKAQKHLRTWQTETERTLDAQYPRNR